MEPRSRRIAAALLVALAGLAGLSDRADAQERTAARPASLSESEFEALYHARTENARLRFTEADVAFVTGMIGHHAQALIMSDLAPTHGASQQVQVLAARITNAQKDEIALMQKWLRDRGQPVPVVKIDGLDLQIGMSGPEGTESAHDAEHAHHGEHAEAAGHGGQVAHAMPGMLTQEQLEALDAAYGPEFDRLFLTGMIHHHGGAVSMVHDLFAIDGAAQDEAVFKLASDIQVDQRTEIARMKLMLDEMQN